MLKALKLYAALQGKYLKPYWPLVLLLAVLLFTSTGLQLIGPQIVRRFIDVAVEQGALRSLYVAVEQGALRSLYVAALVFLAVGLTAEILKAITIYLGRDLAWRATNRLRAELTLHVLRLDMGFHSAHTPGELLERIDGDIERLANFFSQFFVQILGGLLMLAGLVVVTWLEDWRFGLAVAGFELFSLQTQTRILKSIMPFWRAESVARADLYGFLGEKLSGNRDIQKSGAFSYTMRRFYEVHRRRIRSELKAGIISSLAVNRTSTLNSMRMIVGLAVGADLFQRGDITIGTVYLMYHYLQVIGLPVMSIMREFGDLQMAGASIQRVKELLDTAPQIQDGRGARLPSGRLSVEFDDVSFAYNPEVTVLHGVSFHLEPGRTLGLLGRTGSGKTTMSRLLFRFYDPGEGTVRLGDVDVRQLHLKDLRRRVGMVTQDVQVFEATVRDNLTLFDPTIPDDAMGETLDSLGMGPWLRSLPDALDTTMSAGGGQLSAGEAQLLAFARVFLREPDLVVLDEASSRLDPATERLIERAVERLLAERTTIIIAHRLSTVERLDEIMIVEEGRIREHGDRQALVNDTSSRFAGLLKTGLDEVLA